MTGRPGAGVSSRAHGPGVAYALTPRGESLRPVLAALWRWGVRDEVSWTAAG
ncbi:winged helix-turn-helix transcriptional regulator [Micromonospora fulviviridis]|uniref:Winged helix-turn-helix transcriptional regulator n=1 Tax=Micromonospora fulviviridis TaxID=47860 RepID=A0ABV2VJ86_9ACTN